jgi:hypothetical protein
MKFYILLNILILTSKLFSQSIKLDCESLDSIILWNPKNLMNWTDYRGTPDTLKESFDFADAVSNIKYYFDVYKDKKQNIQYIVFVYFNKNGSWVKADSSDELLKHERTHFNIAECTARKARKEAQKLSMLNIEDYSIYYKCFKKMLQIDDSINYIYDLETNYGSLDLPQEKWNDKIMMELDLLKDYSIDYYKEYFSKCPPAVRSVGNQ